MRMTTVEFRELINFMLYDPQSVYNKPVWIVLGTCFPELGSCISGHLQLNLFKTKTLSHFVFSL